MKGFLRLLILLAIPLLIAVVASAQRNYTPQPSVDIQATHVTTTRNNSVSPAIPLPQGQHYNLDVKIPKTEQDCLINAVPTTNTAQYKTNNYQVYATDKGKLFIVIPNKEQDGYHRKYLPK